MSRGKRQVLVCLAAFAVLLVLPASALAAHSIVVQPDGKIVLAGAGDHRYVTGGALARLNPDGSLDESFGVGGALIDFRRWASFRPVAIGMGGRILAGMGGSSPYETSSGFGLAAFEPDGSPSSSFGDDSIAIGSGWQSTPEAIQVLPGGRVVVGGTAVKLNIKGFSPSKAVAQVFEADGSSSEVAGTVGYPDQRESLRQPAMTDLMQRPDGSLIAAGMSDMWSAYSNKTFLSRFVPGSKTSFDASFAGGSGIALVDPFPYSTFQKPTTTNALVASGGRLIGVGAALYRPLLMGFDMNGSIDTTFGETGVSVLPMDGTKYAEATAAAVQPDGKIVIVGKSLDPCQPEGTPDCWNLLVGRANADGSLDTSFGTGGFTRVKPPVGRDTEPEFISVAMAGDGKILLSETTGGSRAPSFIAARLGVGGSLDPSFGNGGIVSITPCQGSSAELRASGCLSSARVRLRTRHLRKGRPSLHLRIEATQELDPLARLQLVLPHGIRARPKSFRRRSRVFAEGESSFLNVGARRASLWWESGAPKIVSLVLPRGTLRRSERIAPGRKLAFRVRVAFQDGSSQTFVVRRSR